MPRKRKPKRTRAKKEGKIRLAIGQKGFGKTTRLRKILVEEAKANPTLPVYIHDVRLGTDGAIGNMASRHWETPADFFAAPDEDKGQRSHAFSSCTPEEVAALGWFLLQRKRGSICVFDELDQFPSMLTAGWEISRGGQRKPRSFGYHLCHYGRTGPVIVLGSARQPQDVAKCWLSQADTIDFFRCSTKQLLTQIQQSGWPDAENLASRLPNLPKFRYITVEK